MLKIVIADDEFPSRQELRALLETNSNLEIIAECEHGEAVLDYFSNNTADAVFLDIEMPVLDGLAVGEKLKTLPNPPKIIFSTGFDHSGGKTGALIADDHRHAVPVEPGFIAGHGRAVQGSCQGVDALFPHGADQLRQIPAHQHRLAEHTAHGSPQYLGAVQVGAVVREDQPVTAEGQG